LQRIRQKIKHNAAEKYYLEKMSKKQVESAESSKIECKACKWNFEKKSILKHISKSMKCKEYYSLPSSKKKLQILKTKREKERRARKKQKKLKSIS